jgi:hypothetical protein
VHFALAAYNAGDSRVVAWQREKPGLPQDEFIDDIPFPETQNYVKRILGTAEDYRRLYGSPDALNADDNDATPAAARQAAFGSAKASVSKAPVKKKAAPVKKKPARRVKKAA